MNTTSTTVTDSTISTKPDFTTPSFDTEVPQITPGSDYPIYMNITVHHNTNHQAYPKDEPISEQTIGDILNNALLTLESTSHLTLPYIETCHLHNTFKKPTIFRDWYSMFHITLKPKQETITYDECNQIMELLYDTVATNTDNCTRITNINTLPAEAKKWIPFTSLHLPNVNSTRDSSYGVVIGIHPSIHGRHHTTCKWILKELFNHTHKYLPPTLQCSNMALFRKTYGIRGGKCKLNGKEYHVYHIHTTDPDNVRFTTGALYEHYKEYGEHAKIFNRVILADSFPINPNGKESIDLKNRLEETEHQLKPLINMA